MIYNGMRKILKDPAFGKEIADNGKKTARSGMFDITEMVKKLEEIYTL